MKGKKFLGTLLTVGMLVMAAESTASAGKYSLFSGYGENNSYCVIMTNTTTKSRYGTVSLKGYNKKWNYTQLIGSAEKVLKNSSNTISLTGDSNAAHVKGFGKIYKGKNSSSGVAESHSKKLK